jgi:hypothetical protein
MLHTEIKLLNITVHDFMHTYTYAKTEEEVCYLNVTFIPKSILAVQFNKEQGVILNIKH